MMIPVFLEAWEDKELAALQICRMVMVLLWERKIAPLPFAKNGQELSQIIAALGKKGLVPGIYVANSYRGEKLLREADPLMGETPLLLLHREIQAFNLISKKSLHGTTQIIKTMSPRLFAVCNYGTQNSRMVADRVAQALLAFLKSDDFKHIELLSSGLLTS